MLKVVLLYTLRDLEEVPVLIWPQLHVSSVSIIWEAQARTVIADLFLVLFVHLEFQKVIVEGHLTLLAL